MKGGGEGERKSRTRPSCCVHNSLYMSVSFQNLYVTMCTYFEAKPIYNALMANLPP